MRAREIIGPGRSLSSAAAVACRAGFRDARSLYVLSAMTARPVRAALVGLGMLLQTGCGRDGGP
jgi:hypothetical protein